MKRANGTGSIVKLSGNRRRPYAVKVSGRNEYGHITQHIVSYHAKASEAQLALEEYRSAQLAGRAPAPDKLSLTVRDVFEAWKAREYRKLKPASINSHNAAWNKRISRFGDRKMRDMTLDEWQSILDEDEENGLSQSSINNDAMLIKALYHYSMERDIVGKDYAAYLDILSVGRKNARDSLTISQVQALAEMAELHVPWADTALILCYTGFRVSELLLLKPEDYHPEEGGYLQGGLKTEAGRGRIVPVHPKIEPYVLRRVQSGGERIISGESGKAVLPARYRALFSALIQRAGAPDATPHWCRHTFASMLHRAGADPLAVKKLMGHSCAADITEQYTHLTTGDLRRAVLSLT